MGCAADGSARRTAVRSIDLPAHLSRLRTGTQRPADRPPPRARPPPAVPRSAGGAAQVWARAQALAALPVVPADPLGDGRPVGVQLRRHRDHRPPLDVSEDGLGAPPKRKVLQGCGLAKQFAQPFHLTERQTRRTDRLTVACSCHGEQQSTPVSEWKEEMTPPLGECV